MVDYRRHLMLSQARQAKRKPNLFLQFLIFFGVFFIPTLLSAVLLAVPMAVLAVLNPGIHPEQIAQSPAATVISLFLTAFTTAGALLYCLCIEKRSLLSMGFQKKTFWKNYGKGLIVGTALLLLCSGISLLFGGFTVEVAEKIPWLYILLFFVGFVIQGSSEEVLCRGYFMLSLSNRCAMPIAVGLSSVVFSLLHLLNPGFGLIPLINIALFGIFMGVYVLREGDLWGACAIHTAWNFAQGNLVGMQVSGTSHTPSILRMLPAEGKELLSGGSFGMEGSLIVTLVLLAAIALTLYFPQKTE